MHQKHDPQYQFLKMEKLRSLINHDCPTILIGKQYGDGNPDEWVVQWYAYDWYITSGQPTKAKAIAEAARIMQLPIDQQEKYKA
jgi:hypothetical protein